MVRVVKNPLVYFLDKKWNTANRKGISVSFLPPFICYINLIQRNFEVSLVVFVTADSCRVQLETLTKLLVSAFPGSTVYQHTDLLRVTHDVLKNNVDAVVLGSGMDKTNSTDFMKMLHRQKPSVPVFMISASQSVDVETERTSAGGCFVLPDDEKQLLDAIRLTKIKKTVV